jgi:hypothetical protein
MYKKQNFSNNLLQVRFSRHSVSVGFVLSKQEDMGLDSSNN